MLGIIAPSGVIVEGYSRLGSSWQTAMRLRSGVCPARQGQEKVWGYCQEKGFSGKTVTVKIKYSDFTQATGCKTGALPFANGEELLEAASNLLASLQATRALRGVTLSTLTHEHADARDQE